MDAFFQEQTYVVVSVSVILNENFLRLMKVKADDSAFIGDVDRLVLLAPLQSGLRKPSGRYQAIGKQEQAIYRNTQEKKHTVGLEELGWSKNEIGSERRQWKKKKTHNTKEKKNTTRQKGSEDWYNLVL